MLYSIDEDSTVMPLFQRKLEPVYLGRQDLSTSVSTNTLDATFINTLGGVLRQLSSLSKFAEDLFAHITDDVGKVRARADKINGKMAKIKGIMVKLNAAEEKGTLWITLHELAFYVYV